MVQQPTTADLGRRLEELESIVKRLEDDPGLSLDDALTLYEEGRRLSVACREQLAHAKQRVTDIDALRDDPVPTEKDG